MTFTVDSHHHMLPDFFWATTNEADNPVGGIAPPPWSRVAALSFLDDAGIDVGMTSISTPGVHTGDDRAARALARRCNELSADLVRDRPDRPDRFGGFGCLPLPDIDGALAELSHVLDVLGLDGVVLFSNAGGVYLGDDRLAPLFDELQRRQTLVFVHPERITRCHCPHPGAAGQPGRLHRRHNRGHRQVALQQHLRPDPRRDLRVLPRRRHRALPGRTVRHHHQMQMGFIPGAEGRTRAAETFRRLYWDTARCPGPDPMLRMLRSTVGLDQVLFGTDYPYLRHDLAVGHPTTAPGEPRAEGSRPDEHSGRHGDEAHPPPRTTTADWVTGRGSEPSREHHVIYRAGRRAGPPGHFGRIDAMALYPAIAAALNGAVTDACTPGGGHRGRSPRPRSARYRPGSRGRAGRLSAQNLLNPLRQVRLGREGARTGERADRLRRKRRQIRVSPQPLGQLAHLLVGQASLQGGTQHFADRRDSVLGQAID